MTPSRRLTLSVASLALLASVIQAGVTPGVTPTSIRPEDARPSLLIPAAANAAGLNGTVFHSDMMLLNQESTARNVAFYWLAEGVDNSAAMPLIITVPPHAVMVLDDFVASLLGTNGVGAVLVRTVNASGQYDPSGKIDAFTRIWSPQPGGSGEVSQPFEAVDETDMASAAFLPQYALGLRQDSHFRTNVGVVNLSTTATNSYSVYVTGTNGNTTFGIVVPPFSMKQVALPAGSYGDLYITVVPETNPHEFKVYGSSVDNATGDAWSSLGVPTSGVNPGN